MGTLSPISSLGPCRTEVTVPLFSAPGRVGISLLSGPTGACCTPHLQDCVEVTGKPPSVACTAGFRTGPGDLRTVVRGRSQAHGLSTSERDRAAPWGLWPTMGGKKAARASWPSWPKCPAQAGPGFRSPLLSSARQHSPMTGCAGSQGPGRKTLPMLPSSPHTLNPIFPLPNLLPISGRPEGPISQPGVLISSGLRLHFLTPALSLLCGTLSLMDTHVPLSPSPPSFREGSQSSPLPFSVN